MATIPIRKISFEFPEVDAGDIVATGNAPLLAFSLALPHLEPYLIRTMKAATPEITKPALVEDVRRFCGQEGHHYRAHRKFNEQVRMGDFPELEAFEAKLSADYQRFTSTKSLAFNLAYAEGFEAMTSSMAVANLSGDVEPPTTPMAELFRWHLLEELEHRTVTFDVYEHLVGRYPYRLVVGTWAQYHYLSWVVRVGRSITETHRARAGGAPEGTSTGPGSQGAMVKNLIRRAARTYLPGYTPHDIVITPEMQAMADHYSARADSVR